MRDFRFGSHHGFNLEHYECPRESGLPISHFETTPWWRYAQRALLVALVLVVAYLAIVR